MQCKADEVVSIEMKEETEGGYIYYKTEEKQLIEEIVNALNTGEVILNLQDRRDGYYILWNKDGVDVGFGSEISELQQMMHNKFIHDEASVISNSKLVKGQTANVGIVKGKVKIVGDVADNETK